MKQNIKDMKVTLGDLQSYVQQILTLNDAYHSLSLRLAKFIQII